MKRAMLMGAGFLALALAGAGLLLPVLPTTPFVLCAAGCFAVASPGLYRRLAATRYFGEYISNYKNKTGIGKKARYTGLAFLWGTLLVSAALAARPLVWGILAVVGVAVSVHILLLPKKRE